MFGGLAIHMGVKLHAPFGLMESLAELTPYKMLESLIALRGFNNPFPSIYGMFL